MNGKPLKRRTRRFDALILFAIIGIVVVIVVVVIGMMAPLSQPRIPMNHMRAAHSARQLLAAERQYAASHPALGFTCDLRQLAQARMIDEVLASGKKAGYQYSLRDCARPATAFTLAAVPVSTGTTGQFAFCGNQDGVLWYARDGSADDCIRARIQWTQKDPLAD